MALKNQENERFRNLFKLPENQSDFELFYKFLSQPARGLSLCQLLPPEQLKISGFFKNDPLYDRIHMVDMAKLPRGPMELQQTIIHLSDNAVKEKNIFFIYNLESAIYLLKVTAEDFFRQMNLIRDFFMQFDATFVFFVTESSLKIIIRNAFDFYDWMKFTFTFVSEDEDIPLQPFETREPEAVIYSKPWKKIDYLKQSIDKISIESERSIRLFELGMLYLQVHDYEPALGAFSKSLEIEEKVPDPEETAVRYNALARTHKALGDRDKKNENPEAAERNWDTALKFALKATEALDKNQNNSKDLIIAYNTISRIYQDQGELSRALEFVGKAAGVHEDHHDSKDILIVYNTISRIYQDKGEPEQALEYGLKAVEIAEKSDNPITLARHYNNLGLIYQHQGNSDKALETLFKALDFFETNNDRESMSIVYSNMGRIYQTKGEDKKASTYFERARKRESDDFNWDELLEQIQSGNVIPVIGHGLYRVEIESKGDGSRLLYDYLAEELMHEVGLTLNPDENHKFAKACFMFIKNSNLYYFETIMRLKRFIAERLEGVRIIPRDSLWKLSRIKAFNIFITTAYDNLLTETVSAVRQTPVEKHSFTLKGKPLPRLNERLFDDIEESECTLVHYILGEMQARVDMALIERDILESILRFFEYGRSNPTHRLFHTLRESSLLFLGCGFDDWLYRLFIRTTSNSRYDIPSPLVAFTPNFVVDNFDSKIGGSLRELPLFLKNYGTEVFQTDDCDRFVDMLFDKLQSELPNQMIQPVDFPTAVFISFEGRDRPAAVRLVSHLRKDGINVWFDEHVLTPGTSVDDRIIRSIDQCQVFIPLISNNSKSLTTGVDQLKYHSQEWNQVLLRTSRKDNQIIIIPVVIDDTEWMYDKFKRFAFLKIKIQGGQTGEDYNRLKKRLSK